MYVGNIGQQVEVFPLKYANNQNFSFYLEANHDRNYRFHVEIKDKNHIIITPYAENRYSLAKVLFGEKELSGKAKNDVSIELKKDK